MEILFVIGNGFDINLGLNTKYTDFYKYYKRIKSNQLLVNKLKADIKNNFANWADLELALGKFTNHINSIEDFDTVFDDIGEHLAKYLEKQEEKLSLSLYSRDRFYEYLGYPERSLPQADINELSSFKMQWKNHQWTINIITLNYTLSIERLFDTPILANIIIGEHHANKAPIVFNGIQHIHGFTDNRMIMGVNDISQIDNKNLHSHNEILEAIIKSNCNRVQKHTVDELCTKQVNSANLICIFGSSMGDTDNNWWELIGEQLKRDARLIIYTKGEEVQSRVGYKVARIERAEKERFLSKTKLSEKEKQDFASNIYVAVNSDMFQLMEPF